MGRKEDRKAQERQKKSLRYRLLTILSIVFAVVGVGLLAQPFVSNYLLTQRIQEQERQLSQLTREEIEANQNANASFDFNDVQSLSLESILAASQNKAKVQSIGEIAIPSVGINLTVAKGVSDLNMSVGAGTLRSDQVMGEGNYPLASHYSSYGDGKLLFTPLLKVELGDKVYLTDLKKVYVYETYWKEVVNPDRVDLVENTPGDNIVTLITCSDGSAAYRLIVRARLTASYDVSQAPTEAIEAFKLTKHTLR
ncbi:class A sortase [Carnobacteriaceae bacterium zg-ZUI252]|nr:class A sortase [Carnobacteriaceae bacterium zg-ZUI252]MBS4769820.1 class A sortase [Carnobacteriaceae bacterium zg-ZUI240]